jgi:hypothetical protein
LVFHAPREKNGLKLSLVLPSRNALPNRGMVIQCIDLLISGRTVDGIQIPATVDDPRLETGALNRLSQRSAGKSDHQGLGPHAME